MWKLIPVGVAEFGAEFLENRKKDMKGRRQERILQVEEKKNRITEEGEHKAHQGWAPRAQLKGRLSWRTSDAGLRNLDFVP